MEPTIRNNAADTFRLEGTLDIYSAERLQVTLMDCLAANDTVVLDLGGVETCDTAGIQLLLSARTTAAEHHKTLQFCAVPEAVATCCQRLGLPALP